MKKNTVYIGLGSNLNDPQLQIKNAMDAIQGLSDTEIRRDSGYFNSRPMGPEDQPDYVNAVIELATGLSAKELLAQCQLIEQQQGRIKTRHWGERNIDLDILLYAEQQIKEVDLTVPHPGICKRDFVYLPLLSLNQNIAIPGQGLLSEIINFEEKNTGEYGCQFAGKIE